MSHRDDAAYYEARAKQEREIASQCEDNGVALAHLRLAEEYERRLEMIRSQLILDPPI